MLQYCKNIYKAVRKVSEIVQEPCNVRSKHYKWNVTAYSYFIVILLYCESCHPQPYVFLN